MNKNETNDTKIMKHINMKYTDRDNGVCLYKGDCLEIMDLLIERGIKVDAIITDPPYGTTACKWDSVIPFNKYVEVKTKNGKSQIMYQDEYVIHCLKTTDKSYNYILDEFNKQAKDGMWDKLNQVVNKNCPILLFSNQPFTSKLIYSNIKNFKEELIWHKDRASNFANAKYRHMKIHENIELFCYDNKYIYNRQMMERKSNRVKQSIKNNNKVWRNRRINGEEISFNTDYEPYSFDKYNPNLKNPESVINNPIVNPSSKEKKDGKHPTQKPVELLEYLIKTYTNEGDIVLDFTMGSGTTGVACINTNRKFIGIELDENYFNISKDRIINAIKEKELSSSSSELNSN